MSLGNSFGILSIIALIASTGAIGVSVASFVNVSQTTSNSLYNIMLSAMVLLIVGWIFVLSAVCIIGKGMRIGKLTSQEKNIYVAKYWSVMSLLIVSLLLILIGSILMFVSLNLIDKSLNFLLWNEAIATGVLGLFTVILLLIAIILLRSYISQFTVPISTTSYYQEQIIQPEQEQVPTQLTPQQYQDWLASPGMVKLLQDRLNQTMGQRLQVLFNISQLENELNQPNISPETYNQVGNELNALNVQSDQLLAQIHQIQQTIYQRNRQTLYS